MFDRLTKLTTTTKEGIALNIPPLTLMKGDITFENILVFLELNPTIQILSIPMNNVNDTQIAELVEIKPLLKLDVYGNDITHVGAATLANSNLLSLTITNNNIGDVGAAALANSKLKTLIASNCDISDEGAKALSGNNTLQVLNLSENEKITQFHFNDNIRLCSVDLRATTNVGSAVESSLPLHETNGKVSSLKDLCLFALKRMDNPTNPNVLGLELTGKRVVV
jgi:Leucine-rich repeat (LRR) protein